MKYMSGLFLIYIPYGSLLCVHYPKTYASLSCSESVDEKNVLNVSR